MTDTEHEHIEPPVVQTRRAWVRGALLGATLLVMGGVIGSSLTVMAIKRQRDGERQERSNMPGRLVERLTSEMDLTAEQSEQIDAIVSAHHEALGEIRRTFGKEAQSEMRAMKDDIAKVLTPEQQAYWEQRWTENLEKMRKRREEHSGERDRHGDGQRRPDRPAETPSTESRSN